MTVKPQSPKQTTTLESPSKILAEQGGSGKDKTNPLAPPRIGFISLGAKRMVGKEISMKIFTI